jgi:hypothetical protein
MFLSATSQRQIAFVNQSSRFTSHAFKMNDNFACVQNRGILFAQCSIYFVSKSSGKGGVVLLLLLVIVVVVVVVLVVVIVKI